MNQIKFYFLALISISALINLINSHAMVYVPSPRDGSFTGQGCHVDFAKAYLTGFKCKTACGNKWLNQYGEVDENDKTRPVKTTYLSGQTFNMLFDTISHGGLIRVRLCKLENPNQDVTLSCLDENLLKIRAFDYGLQVDDHTVRKKKSIVNGVDTHQFINQTISVKLPDGLTCEHCVLQYDWRSHEPGHPCRYENGNVAPNDYCIGQIYRLCMDISILPNPNGNHNLVYKKNPASKYPLVNVPRPQVFSYIEWDMLKTPDGQIIRNTNEDPLRNIGDGVHCFVDNQERDKMKASGQYDAYLKSCRENCLSHDWTFPYRRCPDNCYCRWFSLDINDPLTTTYRGDTLHQDDVLLRNQVLISANRQYMASMQLDGNFCVYKVGDWHNALWRSNTHNNGERVLMQTDGNLVIQRGINTVAWNSGRNDNSGIDAGFRLVMQDDGNLVIYYANGKALWSIYG